MTTPATPAAPGERKGNLPAPYRSVECSDDDKRDWFCVPAASLTEARANAADARSERMCFMTLIQKLNKHGRYMTVEQKTVIAKKASR